jgi:hypothetical protein
MMIIGNDIREETESINSGLNIRGTMRDAG